MFTLFVTVKIKPGHREEFIEATKGDAQGSNTAEPGCLRFDVLADNNDPNTVYLYEVYENPGSVGSSPPLYAALRPVAGKRGRLVRRRPGTHRDHALIPQRRLLTSRTAGTVSFALPAPVGRR